MAMQDLVTVGTAPTQLIAEDDPRLQRASGCWITNMDVADIRVGDAEVTMTTGTLIPPGEAMSWPAGTPSSEPLYAISAAGNAPVQYALR